MGAAFMSSMQQRLLALPLLILSLSVHEFAHAWSAWKLGDNTAERQGRLTLNPMAHIDPIGTLLLPLLGLPFGWAKPVPTNPRNYTRKISMRTGSAIVASAGPLSNVVLAVLSAVLLGVMLRIGRGGTDALVQMFLMLVVMNVSLALFNILPLPPLDGHYLVDALVRGSAARHWETFKGYAPIILLVIIAAPQIAHVSILSAPIMAVAQWLLEHITIVVGGRD